MTLLKKKTWSPVLSDPFFRDFNMLPSPFESDSAELFPAVNVLDGEKNYIIELAVPGYAKEDFEIKVEDGRLVIVAQKEESKKSEEKNYTRKEFSYNHFQRSFNLPENVLEDDIEAKFKDGILKLKLDKKELASAQVSRKIDIK
ncbi:MAG: Hsp20/alpha crystallin family protein [Vicingaceae bacterium]